MPLITDLHLDFESLTITLRMLPPSQLLTHQVVHPSNPGLSNLETRMLCGTVSNCSFSGLVKICRNLNSGFHHLSDAPSIVLLKGHTITENQLLTFLGHLQSGAGHFHTSFSLQILRVFLYELLGRALRTYIPVVLNHCRCCN